MTVLRGLLGRHSGVVVGLLTFAMAAIWSVATPLNTGPDEASHAAKAASTVRGVPLGERTPGRSPGYRDVVIPGALWGPDWQCLMLQPDVTADCISFDLPSGEVTYTTSAGTYPPTYYAVVGLPTLVFTGIAGVRLERLVGAALFGAFVGLAWTAAGWCRRPGAVRAALAVAITPMAVFCGAVINPSGLEISAAVAFWVALLARVSGGGRQTAVMVAVSGVALVLSRAASPLWAALIVAVIALWAGVATRERIVHTIRSLWLALVPVGLAGAAQLAWVKVVGVDDLHEEQLTRFQDVSEAVRGALGRMGYLVQHSIGTVGWLDVYPPFVTVVVWCLAGSGFVVLAAIGARWRQLAALAVLTALWWVMPAVFEADQATQSAFQWQGRYGLPLLVGLPVLAAGSLSFRLGDVVRRRARLLLGVGLWVGHVAVFYWALHRYMVGASGPLWPFGSPAWNPPGGGMVNLVVFAVVTAAFLAALLGLPAGASRSTAEEPPHGSEHALDSGVRRP